MNPSKDRGSYKNILYVYTPNGGNTLKKAAHMAAANQGRLKIIDVIEGLENYEGVLPPAMTERDLEALFLDDRRSIIEEQAQAAGVGLGKIEIRIRFGKAPVEIIREAIASEHDLVVKTAVGSTGLADRLFGTVAKKLIRKCPCPVWIAKPDGPITFQRVLAAIDPMPSSRRSQALNQQILSAASDLARMENGHLDILHCWHLPGEITLSRGRTRISPSELNRMRDVAQKVHNHKARQLVAEMNFENISHKLHVLKGTPTECILSFASQQQSDLIVLGSVALSGLSGLLMGGTAENIADKTQTSVLALKPKDYVSPVVVGE